MYEARQNREKESRQIGGLNRINTQYTLKKVLQCVKITLEAQTKIKTDRNSYNGTGRNNGRDIGTVLSTIGNHIETRWIALLPSPGNPMGSCAEPHALAEALQKVPMNERIDSILQYPSVAKQKCTVGGVQYNPTDVVPGCATCKQWAPGIGDDKQMSSYVKIYIDRTLEKQENEMIKFGKRNRQLGADCKEKNIVTWG